MIRATMRVLVAFRLQSEFGRHQRAPVRHPEGFVLIAFRLQSEFGLRKSWKGLLTKMEVLIAFRLQSEFGQSLYTAMMRDCKENASTIIEHSRIKGYWKIKAEALQD